MPKKKKHRFTEYHKKRKDSKAPSNSSECPSSSYTESSTLSQATSKTGPKRTKKSAPKPILPEIRPYDVAAWVDASNVSAQNQPEPDHTNPATGSVRSSARINSRKRSNVGELHPPNDQTTRSPASTTSKRGRPSVPKRKDQLRPVGEPLIPHSTAEDATLALAPLETIATAAIRDMNNARQPQRNKSAKVRAAQECGATLTGSRATRANVEIEVPVPDPQPEPPVDIQLESLQTADGRRRSGRVAARSRTQSIVSDMDQQSPDASPPGQLDDARDEEFVLPRHIRRTMNLPRPRRNTSSQGSENEDDPVTAYRRPLVMPTYLLSDKDKRNFNAAINNGTYYAARGPLPNNVERYSAGVLGEIQCEGCRAMFYTEEIKVFPADGLLAPCCERGKVRLLEPSPYPPHLKALVEANIKELRQLNNSLCLGAYKANRVNLPGFPWIYKVHGQVHVTLDHAHPLPAENVVGEDPPRIVRDPTTRSNAQLIAFLDPAMSMKEILGRPGGDRLDPHCLEEFVTYLRANNPLYVMFTRMEELIQEQEATGDGRVEVTMVFVNPGETSKDICLRNNNDAPPVFHNEIGALFNSGNLPSTPAIYVMQQGTTFRIHSTNENRHGLLFPVMNPNGDKGWNPKMTHSGPHATKVRNRLTMRDWGKSTVYRRSPLQIELACGALTQQYIVEAAIKCQDNDLNFIRNHLPQDLMMTSRAQLDILLRKVAEEQNYEVGRSCILPNSFSGSEEHRQSMFRHCIETLKHTGMPSLFITMTANPADPEIFSHPEVRRGDGSLNADLVARVFNIKMEKLKKIVKEEKIFGNCTNMIAVVEFQKRGLPHVHMVVTLDRKIETPDDVDELICCELPDPAAQPSLYAKVKKYMVHRECSKVCQDDQGRCKKGYPFNLREETTMADGRGWIAMRRRHGGAHYMQGRSLIDNRRVVPYNPYLLARFDCHVNVMPFNHVNQARYLFKYMTKAPDAACVEQTYSKFGYMISDPDCMSACDRMYASMVLTDGVPASGSSSSRPSTTSNRTGPSPSSSSTATSSAATQTARSSTVGNVVSPANAGGDAPRRAQVLIDQATFFQKGRYMTMSEGMHKLMCFPMSYFMLALVELSVHTADTAPVVFRKGTEEEVALQPQKMTALLAYFFINRTEIEPIARALLDRNRFVNMPEAFRFDAKKRAWELKAHCNKKTIGSLYPVSPKNRELYFLRALIQKHVCPRGYEDLRTVDGVLHDTYRQAAIALGLVKDDLEYSNCLSEAMVAGSPFSMRLLFLTHLIHCAPANPMVLFDRFWESMASKDWDKDRVLRFFARKLRLNNAPLDKELFAGIDTELLAAAGDVLEPDEGTQTHVLPTQAESDADYARLNEQQKIVVDTIIDEVIESRRRHIGMKNRLFFMEGAAGTGKTFTYKVIFEKLLRRGIKTICMAFTGVAAALLPCGRTLHSALGLPVPLTKDSTSYLQPQSEQYKALAEADLLIIDECSMAPVHAYTCASKLLRRIRSAEEAGDPEFGGMVVFLAGDFRQLSPIPGANETEDDVHIRFSPMLMLCHLLRLFINMRAIAEQRLFAGDLEIIGDGTHRKHPSLPSHSLMLRREWIVTSLAMLIQWAFEGDPSGAGSDCAILAPLNASCRQVNEQILATLPGEEITLYSDDSIVDDDPDNPLLDTHNVAPAHKNTLDLDDLNLTTPPGFPDHVLKVKPGAIAIVIRNIDVSSGLVNGTRIRIVSATRVMIRAEVLSGNKLIVGKTISLARIDFKEDVDATIRMCRTQFPIKLAWAMTINKAQGLTLRKVGAYFPRYSGDHGKPYVVFSRVRHPDDIRVFIIPDQRQGYNAELDVWYIHNNVNQRLLVNIVDGRIQPVAPLPRDEPLNNRPPLFRFNAQENEGTDPVVPDDSVDREELELEPGDDYTRWPSSPPQNERHTFLTPEPTQRPRRPYRRGGPLPLPTRTTRSTIPAAGVPQTPQLSLFGSGSQSTPPPTQTPTMLSHIIPEHTFLTPQPLQPTTRTTRSTARATEVAQTTPLQLTSRQSHFPEPDHREGSQYAQVVLVPQFVPNPMFELPVPQRRSQRLMRLPAGNIVRVDCTEDGSMLPQAPRATTSVQPPPTVNVHPQPRKTYRRVVKDPLDPSPDAQMIVECYSDDGSFVHPIQERPQGTPSSVSQSPTPALSRVSNPFPTTPSSAEPSPDFLRTKVHDPRYTRSLPTASPQNDHSMLSTGSDPVVSIMTRRTVDEEERCHNINCHFCVMARKFEVLDIDTYLGAHDPEMEADLLDLGLITDPADRHQDATE